MVTPDERKEIADSRWSTVVPQTSTATRGNIRRSFDPETHPHLGLAGARTLYETFRNGAQINPLGPCLGFRAVSTSGLATPYIYTSYSECIARVNSFAAGLETLGLVERTSDGMLVLCLYMKNCMEWILAEQAIYALGGATVPLYDTLGPDTLRFVLNQTEAQTVVCTRGEVEALCKVGASANSLKTIVVVNGVTPETAQKAEQAGLQVLSYAKVEAVGAHRIATQGHKHSPPSPNDIATFCYTSGTTGNPKGALLSHTNMVSSMAGVSYFPGAGILTSDRHLSYLPLAHIFERIVLHQVLANGASVAFFRGDPTLLIEDMQACKPTMFPAAPRVLNKIHDKIMAGVEAAGGLKKKLFYAALAAKTAGLKHGHLHHSLYDRLIFNKIKKALGMDCLRLLISGSAPLSENVMTFFRCLLGVPVLEGYGQTEGAAAATISHPDDMSIGHVGSPIGSVEIVLMDVPDMGYLHSDREHRGQPCYGRGEICIRGPSVFVGYYKEPEKTKETVDEEGWLHSGDIGMWKRDGSLQIIDRKKNIFKLSQGEYVAPEKIENILGRSLLIAQSFVYGDSLQNQLVGIVVPDEEPVRQWIAEGNDQNLTSSTPFDEVCKSAKLKEALLGEIRRLSSESGLHGFETVKAIYVESVPFSLENNLLTPTFKLKRQQVRDYYEKQIEALYASLPPPRSKL